MRGGGLLGSPGRRSGRKGRSQRQDRARPSCDRTGQGWAWGQEPANPGGGSGVGGGRPGGEGAQDARGREGLLQQGRGLPAGRDPAEAVCRGTRGPGRGAPPGSGRAEEWGRVQSPGSAAEVGGGERAGLGERVRLAGRGAQRARGRRPDAPGSPRGRPYSPCPSSDRCPGPAPSAKTFSPGPGGLGGRVGGAGVPGSPRPLPPRRPEGASSKAGRREHPGSRRGEGAGRGEVDTEGPSGPAQRGPRAPSGRRAGGRRAGAGEGARSRPGRRRRGREEGTSGGGGQGVAAEAPPPPPALKGAGRGRPRAPGAEAGLSASVGSVFSQERSDSPEEKGRGTPGQRARDAEEDTGRRRGRHRGRQQGRERGRR